MDGDNESHSDMGDDEEAAHHIVFDISMPEHVDNGNDEDDNRRTAIGLLTALGLMEGMEFQADARFPTDTVDVFAVADIVESPITRTPPRARHRHLEGLFLRAQIEKYTPECIDWLKEYIEDELRDLVPITMFSRDNRGARKIVQSDVEFAVYVLRENK